MRSLLVLCDSSFPLSFSSFSFYFKRCLCNLNRGNPENAVSHNWSKHFRPCPMAESPPQQKELEGVYGRRGCACLTGLIHTEPRTQHGDHCKDCLQRGQRKMRQYGRESLNDTKFIITFFGGHFTKGNETAFIDAKRKARGPWSQRQGQGLIACRREWDGKAGTALSPPCGEKKVSLNWGGIYTYRWKDKRKQESMDGEMSQTGFSVLLKMWDLILLFIIHPASLYNSDIMFCEVFKEHFLNVCFPSVN